MIMAKVERVFTKEERALLLKIIKIAQDKVRECAKLVKYRKGAEPIVDTAECVAREVKTAVDEFIKELRKIRA